MNNVLSCRGNQNPLSHFGYLVSPRFHSTRHVPTRACPQRANVWDRRQRRKSPQTRSQEDTSVQEQALETRASSSIFVLGGKKYGPRQHWLGSTKVGFLACAIDYPQMGPARCHGSDGFVFVGARRQTFGGNARERELLRRRGIIPRWWTLFGEKASCQCLDFEEKGHP